MSDSDSFVSGIWINYTFVCRVEFKERFTEESRIHETNWTLTFRTPLTVDEHAILALEMQSALRLTVGYAKSYCKLQEICHVNIELKLN